MATLQQKLEAAAAQRLKIDPGTEPRQELARYKHYLKLETHRLKILHRAGGSGREICAARASVLDLLIRSIFDAIRLNLKSERSLSDPISIVATGGYGRGELNPFSDIDVMFLHAGDLVIQGKPKPYLAAVMDGLLYTLWDLGLKVGHAVRSVEDCVRAANADMQSKTALIEARLVAGDVKLFDQMQRVVVARCIRGHEAEYLTARITDQESRRTKYGHSAYMHEPNIKNGSGGLRDYQNLLWMIYFKYRTHSLKDLEARSLIRPVERKQLESAYDYLLRTRNELHYHSGRAVDVLARSVQPAVAHNLGYTDRSTQRRIEQFMRDLYTHMRNIYLLTRTLEQRLALIPQPERLASLRGFLRRRRERASEQSVDGFRIVGDEIQAAHARIFKEQPRRLMRVFLHIQQRGLRLHPDLTQLMRDQLALVNREFLRDPHVHETFQEILNQRGNVAPVMRLMHEVGILGKYVPEFGKLTALVQHEFFHQFTTDEHTLVCLEKLDQIHQAKEPPFSRYAELFQQLERPFILYLALLLHDAGKGLNLKKHSDAGARLALLVGRRLGLDGATTHTLRLLIEQHLTMAQISQRRDLDDPGVIRQFAELIQSRENLAMLTLHTFVDSQATSPDLWNGFKDSLLWTLHHKSMEILTGGSDFLRAAEQQEIQLKEEVRALVPRSFSAEEIQAHFDCLPARYFRMHTAKQVVRHLAMAHQFMHLQIAEEDKALEPVVHWSNEADRGHTAVTICTWDRAGLFSKIVGSLSAAGLNILSAHIFTRQDGIILDTFLVNETQTEHLASRAAKETFERLLRDSLTGRLDLAAHFSKWQRPRTTHVSPSEERIPTLITFERDASQDRMVVEIQTEDCVGLLYVISKVFSDLNLDVSIAKISTEKGAAIDSFYIATGDNSRLVDPTFQSFLKTQLIAAIHSLAVTVE